MKERAVWGGPDAMAAFLDAYLEADGAASVVVTLGHSVEDCRLCVVLEVDEIDAAFPLDAMPTVQRVLRRMATAPLLAAGDRRAIRHLVLMLESFAGLVDARTATRH